MFILKAQQLLHGSSHCHSAAAIAIFGYCHCAAAAAIFGYCPACHYCPAGHYCFPIAPPTATVLLLLYQLLLLTSCYCLPAATRRSASCYSSGCDLGAEKMNVT